MAKRFKQDPEIVSVNCDVTNWVIYTFLDLKKKTSFFGGWESESLQMKRWKHFKSNLFKGEPSRQVRRFHCVVPYCEIYRIYYFLLTGYCIYYHFQCGFANQPSGTHKIISKISSNVSPRQLSVVFLDMESKSFMSKRSFGDSGFGVNHWNLAAEI